MKSKYQRSFIVLLRKDPTAYRGAARAATRGLRMVQRERPVLLAFRGDRDT
ncbi:hypothetical protein QE400_001437 [Xanthomonas sacchari]|uniref:hypothetical protein n=1 Tax=Xanthomonas sacchari TaxID=56458 RepID=UPI002784EC9D|nr:hypothetical protein [Xanthomonas sacchari]MDQ1092024.1 hypothetical protein [Xanthomonas sacchari]